MDHLIGAFGMFWDRNEVEWNPGQGNRWQLLGRRHERSPALRVCDFRVAQGFYILWDDYGASYVGLAGSGEGLGARLQQHHVRNEKSWTRFSWFAFNDVVDADLEGWAVVEPRQSMEGLTPPTVLKECEALLITALGSARPIRWEDGKAIKAQNLMQFVAGHPWEQLTALDFRPGQVARRVDTAGYWDAWLGSLLDLDNE